MTYNVLNGTLSLYAITTPLLSILLSTYFCNKAGVMTHRRGRPHTVWMDNIKTWIGLRVEQSIRITEDGD